MTNYKIMTHNAYNSLESKDEIMYMLTDENGNIEEINVISNNRVIVFREGKTLPSEFEFEPDLLGILNRKIGESIELPQVNELKVNYTNDAWYYFFKEWVDINNEPAPTTVPENNITLYASRHKIEVPHKMKIQKVGSEQSMMEQFIINSSIPVYFKSSYLGDVFELHILELNRNQVSTYQYSQTLSCYIDCSYGDLQGTTSFEISMEIYKDQYFREYLGTINFEIELHISNSSTGD